MRSVSYILSGLVSNDVQSDSKVSNTFAENATTTGVTYLLILLAVKDSKDQILDYTDLGFIPDSIQKNIFTIYANTTRGHKYKNL